MNSKQYEVIGLIIVKTIKWLLMLICLWLVIGSIISVMIDNSFLGVKMGISIQELNKQIQEYR